MIITCPTCRTVKIYKKGVTQNGAQRYQCKNDDCPRDTFTIEPDKLSFNVRVKLENYRMLKDAVYALLESPNYHKKESERKIANLAGVLERIEFAENARIENLL